MSISEFLRRFLYHTTSAATALVGLLVVGEWLVPGSVLPFFNLIDAVLVLTALILFTGFVVTQKNE